MSKQPVVSTEKLINLLANGANLPEIARSHNITRYSLYRQIERLKIKHECKTNVQLVAKLYNSGKSTMQDQPK